MSVSSDQIVGCSIVARNYVAQAQVLSDSFRQYHPGSKFVLLVIDQPEQTESGTADFELLTLRDIELDAADIYRMPMIYNVTELSTAVKPWLLRVLLARGAASVLYFDPDIEIFAPLDDVAALAAKHSIVLTPHITEPMPRDKFRLNESDILGSGIYNLGFIGVGKGSSPFLDWWATRLKRESIIDPARMRFTDQRWIDFVPGMYPHFILRDTSCNVAYWNLYSRRLEQRTEQYYVDGKPLRFFHFSGYNPDKPHILSKHQGDQPRILLSENATVARICDEYRAKLLAGGFDEAKRQPYGYDALPNGVVIDEFIRSIYRKALLEFEEHGGEEPPLPFADHGLEEFMQWLNTPLQETGPAVTRYMLAIHAARRDLQAAFPDPRDKDSVKFHEWFVHWGRLEQSSPAELVPCDHVDAAAPATLAVADTREADAANLDAEPSRPCVTVAGYFRAELGVGEAGRLLLAALDAAKIPYSTVLEAETLNRQTHDFEPVTDYGVAGDILIMCVNADQTPAFVKRARSKIAGARYKIGLWFWEVEDFPASLHQAFACVDEIWVASDFVREALLKVCPRPVFKIRLPVLAPTIDLSLSRSEVGLPDRFTFLFVFDFLSVLDRKNPLGLIQAFSQAFSQGEGAALVIKTINGDKRVEQRERLRRAAHSRSDIVFIDDYMSAVEKNTMIALCDCYVSLHRSEGLGLTIAEAMALQRPVIGTGYSGNLEFMSAGNSYLCSFDRVPVGEDRQPYPADSHWAEPKIDEAAVLMREVYSDYASAKARAKIAAQDISRSHSPLAAGGIIQSRIQQIRQGLQAADAARAVIDEVRVRLEQTQRELSRQRARYADATARLRDAESRLQSLENRPLVRMFASRPTTDRNGSHSNHDWNDDLLFCIDEPVDWRAPDGELRIKGWCFAAGEDQVAGLRAVFGDHEEFAWYGFERPDVEQVYPNSPFASRSGFEFNLVLPGSVDCVRLEAIIEGGSWRRFFEHEVRR